MTYCFKCRTCGFTTESSYRSLPYVPCPECGEETLARDWRAEGARVNTASLRTTTGRGIT